MNRLGALDALRDHPTVVQTTGVQETELQATDARTSDAQTANTPTVAAATPADRTTADDSPDPAASGFRSAASAARREPYVWRVLDLLILLFHRKGMILRTTFAAALLAAMVTLLVPNRYTATARILPPQQSQSLAASMIGQLGALGPMAAMAQKDLGLKNPSDLYVGMLRSRTVEDALIRRFDLLRVYRDRKMSDARQDLEDASGIAVGKEGFIAISVEDRDRGRAPQIANAYVDELRKLTQDLAVTEAGQRRLFFERQLELARNNLSDAEQALKQTEQQTGLIQLDGQAKAIIESVARLRALIAAKEVELHAMRLFSTELNPDVRLGEQQLSGLRAQLALLERQSGGGSGNVQLPAGSVPEAGLQYIRRLRDVKYAETIFELLAKQYEAARLDEAKTAAVIQVLDPAIEPDRNSSPRRILMILGTMALGLIGAVGYAIVAAAFVQMNLDPGAHSRFEALGRQWKPSLPIAGSASSRGWGNQ